MTPRTQALALVLAAAAAAATPLAARAADEDDALDLQATPPAPRPGATAPAATAPAGPAAQAAAPVAAPAPQRDLRLALEAAALQAERSGSQGQESGHRLALDLRWSGRLDGGWRFGLSSRLDDIHPAPLGQRSTRNNLREAYLGWQSADGERSLELGRVNLRHGPAYGYNPTDFFRSGAARTIVSADPVALRENRLGTFLLRGSQLWAGGGAALTWAPRLSRSGPSDEAVSLDLGATNARHRVLLSVNAQASERWSGEALALYEEGGRSRLGLNFTGLLSDWAVLHGELSTGKTRPLLAEALGQAGALRRSQQAALGATFTLPGGTSLTAEALYNGAGLNRSDWRQLFSAGPAPVAGLLAASQLNQDLAARSAWLLYASHKGLFVKSLDATGFVRHNADDGSRVAWAELRYHWPRVDAALQWQRSFGGARTEYGALPYRQVLQLVGTLYF